MASVAFGSLKPKIPEDCEPPPNKKRAYPKSAMRLAGYAS